MCDSCIPSKSLEYNGCYREMCRNIRSILEDMSFGNRMQFHTVSKIQKAKLIILWIGTQIAQLDNVLYFPFITRIILMNVIVLSFYHKN